MFKSIWMVGGLILITSALAACAATPTPVPPTPTSRPSPTAPPTLPPTPEPPATLAPTPTLLPTAPIAASPTRAGVVATATRASTRAPTITPPPAQAGLFVNNLRIAPDPPVRGTDLEFYPTFINNTNVVQNKRWIVYIYRSETPNRSTGETPRTNTNIPQGVSEQKTTVGWKLGVGGPCEYFFARVAYIDEQENKPVFFTQPNGKVFEKPFTLCPP
ncbi:MAG: hypothetical protein HY868_23670 [Chloroflexi bacterium]|nr:hypothetical protein [Chloroflexota bacterium]